MGVGPGALADRAGRWRLAHFAAGAHPDELRAAPRPGAFWESYADAPAPSVATTPIAGGAAGTVLAFTFASRADGIDPAARTVRGRLFLAADASAPCVVLVHGLGAGRPAFEERLALRELRRGRSSLHLILPGHGSRRVPGRRSGDVFLCADPVATRANLLQSTLDVVDCVEWRRRSGARHVGVVGFSLGGLVACLAATRTRLDRMVAVTPPADLAWTGTHLLPARSRHALGLDRVPVGVAVDQLRAVTPRHLAPRMPSRDIGLVAAARDRVVGCGPVLELARAWGVRHTWLVPRGHMTALLGWGWIDELVDFGQGAVPTRRRLPIATLASDSRRGAALHSEDGRR